MPRPRRIVTTEYFYHLYNRFVDGKSFFKSKEIVEEFFSYFYKAAEKFGVEVYILYCMPNHFHALIRLTKENLSEFLQYYSVYACKRLNKKLKRKGHIFQGRHKTQIIDSDRYLSTVVKYIFINAVKAGIVNKVEDFQWSNINDFLKNFKSNDIYRELVEIIFQKKPEKISCSEILTWLNDQSEKNEFEIKKIHSQFLMDDINRNEILKKINRRSLLKKNKINRSRRQLDKICKKKEIFLEISNKINNNFVRNIYPKKWINVKKMCLHIKWYILYNYYTITLKEIAEFENLKRHQTISNAIRAIDKNFDKKNICLEILKKIKF